MSNTNILDTLNTISLRVGNTTTSKQSYFNLFEAARRNLITGEINTALNRGDLVNYQKINSITLLVPNKVDVWKITYLSNTSLNEINICTATLYLPVNCKLDNVVSYRHQTYPEINEKYFGWNRFSTTNINSPNYTDNLSTNIEFIVASLTKYLVIVPDGPSANNYLSNDLNILQSVDALRALRQFIMLNQNSLFFANKVTNTFVMNVVQAGYEGGSAFAPSVMSALQVFTTSPGTEFGFYAVKNIICGAPVNFYNIFQVLYQINNDHQYYYSPVTNTLVVDFAVVYEILLYLSSKDRKVEANTILTSIVKTQVMDLFYSPPLNRTVDFTVLLATKLKQLFPSEPLTPAGQTLGSMDISKVLDINKLMDNLNLNVTSDFTNQNTILLNLANIPTTTVYSTSDELCVFKNVDGCALFDTNIPSLLGKTKENVLNIVLPFDATGSNVANQIKSLGTNQYQRISVVSQFTNQLYLLNGYTQLLSNYLLNL